MHGHTKLSTVEQSHTMWKPQASCLHNTESRVESSTKLPWLVEHGFQLDPQGCRELHLLISRWICLKSKPWKTGLLNVTERGLLVFGQPSSACSGVQH